MNRPDRVSATIAGLFVLCCVAFVSAIAQSGVPVQPTNTAPSGACPNPAMQYKTPEGTIYTCRNGTWATGGGGGVTSVTGVLPISSTGGATPAISVAAATTMALGVVQPDGVTITISDGVISSMGGGGGGGTDFCVALSCSGLSAGSAYYLGSSGLALAEANASTTAPAVCVAVTTTSCPTGGTYTFGSSQSWTEGLQLWLSDASGGAIVTSAIGAACPIVTSGHLCQRLGFALSSTEMAIFISPDVGSQ